jgi:hypothetical protein
VSPPAVARLVEAPWFGSLEVLRVTVVDRAIVDALATRTTPALRELEIDCYELELTAADVSVLVDRERRPALTRLILQAKVTGDVPSRPGVQIDVMR